MNEPISRPSPSAAFIAPETARRKRLESRVRGYLGEIASISDKQRVPLPRARSSSDRSSRFYSRQCDVERASLSPCRARKSAFLSLIMGDKESPWRSRDRSKRIPFDRVSVNLDRTVAACPSNPPARDTEIRPEWKAGIALIARARGLLHYPRPRDARALS